MPVELPPLIVEPVSDFVAHEEANVPVIQAARRRRDQKKAGCSTPAGKLMSFMLGS